MLPRWLTALPRLANAYRDEILVVSLGLVYQFGIGSLRPSAHHHARGGEDVVVRIAEHPHAMVATETMVAVEAAMAAADAADAADAVAAVAALAPMTPVAPAAHATRAGRAGHTARVTVAPRAPRPHAVAAPAASVAPAPAPMIVVPAVPATSDVRVIGGTGRATRYIVSTDAGENIAASLDLRAEVDTVIVPDIRHTLEQLRATMDEARIRAAIQKALAAEQTRQGQGA
jgi:hypothetical protein